MATLDRVDESREVLNRIDEFRARLKMGPEEKLYVDPKSIPEGMEYRWIRDTVHDDPKFSRIVEMRRRGWTPVPASRHPDMVVGAVPWRVDNKNQWIFREGLVLSERPKELGELEKETNENDNIKIMQQMHVSDQLMSEPTMPAKVFANEVSHTQIRTFKKD